MKLKDVISRVDGIKPNAFSNEVKTGWICELENMVQTEIFLLAPEEMVEYTWEANAESELLIKAPYSKLYWIYLSAMIDFTHGEYDKYSQTMQMFNSWLTEYQIWYARTFRPADGGAVQRGYYLSAYGLAKLHGFTGTEEEWLASLEGPKGDPFTYEDFTPEQLEALKGKNGDSSNVTLEDVTSGGRTGVAVTVTNTSGDGNSAETKTKYIYNGTNGRNGTHGADSELQLKRSDPLGGLIVTVINTVYPESGGPAVTQTNSQLVPDGKSAYAYAKEAGYTGTEEEFAKLLAGIGTSSGGVSFTPDETLTLDPETNVLSVNTTDKVEADNTLPITSAAVYTTVGNIEALLATI